MRNIAAILRTQAIDRPHTPAIIDDRAPETLTFAELEKASGQAAALLRQAGLKAGEAVLIFQPMSAQLYVALMAVFRLGAIAMFVDPSAGIDHLERCCQLFPPKALIASAKAHLLRLRSPVLNQILLKVAIGFPVWGAVHWKRAKALVPLDEIVPCTAETPALLTFTSGSTGQPKAALRTHGFLLAQHQVLAKSLHLTAGEIDLTTLPIFALANLASGVTSLIPDADLRFPGRINAAKVMAQILRYQPHRTAASPAFLERLASYGEQHQIRLTSFKKVFSGGAPVFPNLLERLHQLAPQAEVSAVYGSTEAEPIAHLSDREICPADRTAMLEGKGLLAGTPVPEIRLHILPDRWGTPIAPYSAEAFAADRLPPGAVGEIVVSGDHVLPSYLWGQGNEETKFQVAGVPWHRTGDAGWLDAAGRLWLMGRCRARISDHDGVLYPFAIEVMVQQFPGIRRGAIVSHRGRRVLVIELGVGEAIDLTKLKHQLAWAQIAEYRLVKRIPVDQRHNAKIDYPSLYQLLDEG